VASQLRERSCQALLRCRPPPPSGAPDDHKAWRQEHLGNIDGSIADA
jgi:hypothetical protein